MDCPGPSSSSSCLAHCTLPKRVSGTAPPPPTARQPLSFRSAPPSQTASASPLPSVVGVAHPISPVLHGAGACPSRTSLPSHSALPSSTAHGSSFNQRSQHLSSLWSTALRPWSDSRSSRHCPRFSQSASSTTFSASAKNVHRGHVRFLRLAGVPLCGLLHVPLCVSVLLFGPPATLLHLISALSHLYGLADFHLRSLAFIPRAIGLHSPRTEVGWSLTSWGRAGIRAYILGCLPGMVHRLLVSPVLGLLLVTQILQKIGRRNILLLILWTSSPGFATFATFLLPPSESRKIRNFYAGVDFVDQPSSSYFLSVDSSADILEDLNDRISFATSRMRSKKVSELPPYLGVCSRGYYYFFFFFRRGGGGGGGFCSRLLPWTIAELAICARSTVPVRLMWSCYRLRLRTWRQLLVFLLRQLHRWTGYCLPQVSGSLVQRSPAKVNVCLLLVLAVSYWFQDSFYLPSELICACCLAKLRRIL